jgi:hypothetical protein
MRINRNQLRRWREALSARNGSDTCTCGSKFLVIGDDPPPERCWRCGKPGPQGVRIEEVEVVAADGEIVEVVPIGHLGCNTKGEG